VINLKSQSSRLAVSAMLLARADEVIE